MMSVRAFLGSLVEGAVAAGKPVGVRSVGGQVAERRTDMSRRSQRFNPEVPGDERLEFRSGENALSPSRVVLAVIGDAATA